MLSFVFASGVLYLPTEISRVASEWKTKESNYSKGAHFATQLLFFATLFLVCTLEPPPPPFINFQRFDQLGCPFFFNFNNLMMIWKMFLIICLTKTSFFAQNMHILHVVFCFLKKDVLSFSYFLWNFVFSRFWQFFEIPIPFINC